MTIIEMRDELNKLIDKGKGDDLLVVNTIDITDVRVGRKINITEGILE